MTQVIFFSYFGLINAAVEAYIFRLPCKRHANFTKFAIDHYFHGTVISTFEPFDKEDCALNCFSHDTCAFFNYVNQNKTCELLDRAEGDIKYRKGTDIFYAKSFPMENYEENGCGVNAAKFLDCSVAGYTCKLMKNEALRKTAEASTFYSNNFLSKFINDDEWLNYRRVCWASASTIAAHWIMIDMEVSVDVLFLEIFNAPSNACYGACDDQLFDFNVTIGNNKESTTKNALCLFNVNQKDILRKKYDCLGGVTSGRYVALKQNKGSVERIFVACELRVYAVDKP